MSTNSKDKDSILDFLNRTAESIAITFGSSCETLIHDMSVPGHPIVAIYNGHVSGRTVGSTEDIFGENQYKETGNFYHYKNSADIVNALAVTSTGRSINSTTVNYTGKDYHYALGINFDITAIRAAEAVLGELSAVKKDLKDEIDEYNSSSQLDQIFNDCVMRVGVPVQLMKKRERMQLIELLLQTDAFSFQKSITYVADKLGISRYTVYKYIHEIEDKAR